jgi:hypothetical protein
MVVKHLKIIVLQCGPALGEGSGDHVLCGPGKMLVDRGAELDLRWKCQLF